MRRAVPWLLVRPRRTVVVVLVAGAVASAVWVARGSVAERSAEGPAALPWPPIMEVAPPPLDAPPRADWLTLRVRVLDGALGPAVGAAVQVWVDGRARFYKESRIQPFKRADMIDPPGEQTTWLSGAAFTDADGVAAITVPPGTATHLVAFNRDGRQAVFELAELSSRNDPCTSPCSADDCGTCSEGAPCTTRRSARLCSFWGYVLPALVLAEPALLTGRIVDERGRPVAGARVMALTEREARSAISPDQERQAGAAWLVDEWRRVAAGPPHEAPVVSDARGRFAVRMRGPGPFVLLADPTEHHLTSRTVAASAGAHVDVTLRTRRAASIPVRVLDPEGRPLAAEVRVPMTGEWEPTGPDGRFVLTGFEPGSHLVEIDAPGFAGDSFRLPTGRETVVRLARTRHVTVDVVAPLWLLEALGDRPLIEVHVVSPALRQQKLHEPDAYVELGPDGTGRATVEGLEPGDYTVWAAWRGGLVRGPDVRVDDSGASTSRVHLSGGTSLSGAIQERTPGGLEDVTWFLGLELRHPTLPIGTYANVDHPGRYSFRMLPAGRWHLGDRRGRVPLRIRPGGNHRDVVVAPTDLD